MIIFSCEKGCENMNYVKYHVKKRDARRNNVKYHVKKSVKLKLEDQKCMAFHLPPLAKITSQLKYPVKKYFQLYYIYYSKFQLSWPRTLAYFTAIMSIM